MERQRSRWQTLRSVFHQKNEAREPYPVVWHYDRWKVHWPHADSWTKIERYQREWPNYWCDVSTLEQTDRMNRVPTMWQQSGAPRRSSVKSSRTRPSRVLSNRSYEVPINTNTRFRAQWSKQRRWFWKQSPISRYGSDRSVHVCCFV